MDIRLNRSQKERLFRLLEKGTESLAYWWNCEMDGEHKDAVIECMKLQSTIEEQRAVIGNLREKYLCLKAENIKLRKQVYPNYSPIRKI